METEKQPKQAMDSIKEDLSASQNTLMISNKRYRFFYERAARELFASGNEALRLSALGDAVTLAVQVALTLRDKKAAIITKIETKNVLVTPDVADPRRKGRGKKTVAYGICITITKHPEFKGTRIVPKHVFFLPPNVRPEVEVYPQHPDRVFASVNYGIGEDVFESTDIGLMHKKLLQQAGHDIEAYKKLHQHLFSEALEANKTETQMHNIKFVGELAAVKELHKDLKAAFCRVCPILKDTPNLGATGTVYIHVFNDNRWPHDDANNYCIVHVVVPKGSDFASEKDYLDAVELTATNMQTSFCDYNGYVRRNDTQPKLKSFVIVRVYHFPADDNIRHPKTTKMEVARAYWRGLNKGYHFGPSPNIQVSSKDDILKKIWLEESGLAESDLQMVEEAT